MNEIKSGDSVLHRLFGPGVVCAVSGSGPDAKISVDFASGVGRKTLLASVANLKLAGGSTAQAAWYEALEASGRPRRGKWVDRDGLRQTLLWEVRRPQFWMAVREKLRARKLAPKMLDDPGGRVSVSAGGVLTVKIRVKHDAPKDAENLPCASAVFELLQENVLRDFEWYATKKETGLDFALVEDDLIYIEEEKLDALPERAPLQRPKKVAPKGTIRATPKRRDDY